LLVEGASLEQRGRRATDRRLAAAASEGHEQGESAKDAAQCTASLITNRRDSLAHAREGAPQYQANQQDGRSPHQMGFRAQCRLIYRTSWM